ncbi:hypothetical protein AAGT00_29050 [Streptomyces cavourensis]|uniref:hypothetical protein n=1 Tax=Streptomyces TaxID=1883 RepID=UPI001C38B0E7|nr:MULTISPECIES: hypothetical protein [Streptomyces]MBV2357351.1 hypothetical protein [Streptomyces corallincola]UQA32333.1 hypothetical protein KRR37_00090 [Streptomyces sp. HNA39]
MQVAGVEFRVNHPVLALGSTDWLPALELGSEAAVGCDTHVVVRVQAQVQLIKVRLFTEPVDEGLGPDPSFTTVFERPMSLADGRLVIGDVMGVTRFVSLIGEAGRRQVRVAVNEPGWTAVAVDVFVGPKL